jgi:hypothetical protein
VVADLVAQRAALVGRQVAAPRRIDAGFAGGRKAALARFLVTDELIATTTLAPVPAETAVLPETATASPGPTRWRRGLCRHGLAGQEDHDNSE